MNIISWGSSIILLIHPSIIFLGFGMIIWILYPIIEAAGQTVIKSIVPFECQGRVFGFASSVESFANPLPSF